jgi:hypothetical protein
MARSAYTKLTGRNRGLMGYSQLWLAPDHILLLTSSRFTEEYKRFSIADIQAIVVAEIPPNIGLQVVMVVAALAWMGLWFAVDSKFAKWFFEVTGGLALLRSISDIARGPRCRSYLQTRVSRELLEPLNRIKTARRVLATLRPMIEAVQGVLEPSSFPAPVSTSEASVAPPPAMTSAPVYLPEIVFGLFFVNAILFWASAAFPKIQEIPGMLISTLPIEALLVVVALARRKGRDPRVVPYVILAASIVAIGFDVVSVVRDLGGWFISLQEKARNGDKIPSAYMTLFPGNPNRAVIASIWRVVAGAVGLGASLWGRMK